MGRISGFSHQIWLVAKFVFIALKRVSIERKEGTFGSVLSLIVRILPPPPRPRIFLLRIWILCYSEFQKFQEKKKRVHLKSHYLLGIVVDVVRVSLAWVKVFWENCLERQGGVLLLNSCATTRVFPSIRPMRVLLRCIGALTINYYAGRSNK